MSKSDIILKNDLSEFKHLNYYNLVHFTNYIIYKIIIDDLSPDQMMELIEKFSNDFVLLPEDCWFIHRNLIGFFNLLSDKGIHFRLKLYESNGFKNNSANFLSVPSNFFYNFLSIK